MVASDTLYLESYIVPVCGFELTSSGAKIREYFVTAFFVDGSGTFLTAGHVVRNGMKSTKDSERIIGLCPRPPGSNSNVACPVQKVDFAPEPFDVAVGNINQGFPTKLALADTDVGTWKEVATYGYPVTSQKVTFDGFWMYGRGFRGYIHRDLEKDHHVSGDNPSSFETSFAVPKGLSGAPLFIRSEPRDIVVGICVGTNRGESVEFLREELEDSGDRQIERISRIEEYGLAHDLRPLLELRFPVLGDRTLGECAA